MAFGEETAPRTGIFRSMETFRRWPWVADKADIVALCKRIAHDSGRDFFVEPPNPNNGKSPSQRLAMVERPRKAALRYRGREWASEQAKRDCDRLLSIIGYPGDELPAIFRPNE